MARNGVRVSVATRARTRKKRSCRFEATRRPTVSTTIGELERTLGGTKRPVSTAFGKYVRCAGGTPKLVASRIVAREFTEMSRSLGNMYRLVQKGKFLKSAASWLRIVPISRIPRIRAVANA